MKTKLILGAIVPFAFVSVSCADTLEQVFTDSKVKGEVKMQYFIVEPVSDGKKDSIFAVGGNLGLTTGSFYGLSGGVTFQTSHIINKNIKNSNNFVNTMDASGAVMSESYLSYSLANTSLKVGRQYISTPLVAGSGSRMIKQSFEGITIVNKDISDTIVSGAYVHKYQNRTDGNGNPGEFESFEDGAYTLYLQNKSVKNLDLKAQYLKVKSKTKGQDKKSVYLEANYDFGLLKASGQYIDTSNGNIDGKLWGLKASGNLGMFNLTGIYTSSTGDGTVYSGVGSGADPSFSALPLHGGSVTYTKDTDTVVGVVATNIAGVTAVAYYGQVNTDDKSLPYTKIDAMGGFLQYAFNKNFSAKIMYESADFDKFKNDDNIFRIYTSYKF